VFARNKQGFAPIIGCDDLETSLLYAGTLETYQGIDLLLQSMAEVKRRGISAGLIIVGGSKDQVSRYQQMASELTIDDIDWDYIAGARHLHLGCFFLQTGIRKDVGKLFAKAQEMGLTTSMDTNWDPDDKWGNDLMEALEFTDIFLPNDDEALRIARTDNLDAALDKLSKMVKVLAVKRGRAGATVCVDGKTYTDSGFTVEAVETTGAGDSFNAGFLHKYLQGAGWQECLRWGNACGAIAVTALGGTGAFVNPGEVQQKLKELVGNG